MTVACRLSDCMYSRACVLWIYECVMCVYVFTCVRRSVCVYAGVYICVNNLVRHIRQYNRCSLTESFLNDYKKDNCLKTTSLCKSKIFCWQIDQLFLYCTPVHEPLKVIVCVVWLYVLYIKSSCLISCIFAGISLCCTLLCEYWVCEECKRLRNFKTEHWNSRQKFCQVRFPSLCDTVKFKQRKYVLYCDMGPKE